MSSPQPSTQKQIFAPVSRRRRCTDVLGRVEAQSFSVTTAGDRVAIHCPTAEGTVVILGPLAAFIAAARADRDANGRPFAVRCRSLAVLEADAAQAEVQAAQVAEQPRPRRPWRSRLSPEVVAATQAALARFESGEATLGELAAAQRLVPQTLSTRFKILRRLRAAAGARPAVLKPGGKIL